MNKEQNSVNIQTQQLNIASVISHLYQDLSNKHEIKISDLLISLRSDKLYCYSQDEFGYLIQLDVVSLNDL